MIRAIA